jgi:hypothetical protein
VGAVVSDLLLWSRIAAAADDARNDVMRVDAPVDLPDGLDLVLVDWSARGDAWAAALAGGGHRRVILFGPHVDIEAHEAARDAGLGPMWARSRLLRQLPDLLAGGRSGGVATGTDES